MSESASALTKIRLAHPIHFFSLGFGSGLMRLAPGAWGSLAGLLIGLIILQWMTIPYFFIFIVFCFVVGCYLCQKTAAAMGVHDHGAIVFDEIVAMFLILPCLPSMTFYWCLAGFIIFRFFDIKKPYPILLIDRSIRSGLGIMLDDIIAAFYTIISIYAINLMF